MILSPQKNSIISRTASHRGGVLIVHDNGGVLDKTWQQINDATFVAICQEDSGEGWSERIFQLYGGTESEDDSYIVHVGLGGEIYETDSPDGYPENK